MRIKVPANYRLPVNGTAHFSGAGAFDLSGCALLQVTVVNRDIVAVVTRGTMADAEMTAAHPEASFLLALCECATPAASDAPTQPQGRYTGDVQTTLGACAVDVATGQILFGQW